MSAFPTYIARINWGRLAQVVEVYALLQQVEARQSLPVQVRQLDNLFAPSTPTLLQSLLFHYPELLAVSLSLSRRLLSSFLILSLRMKTCELLLSECLTLFLTSNWRTFSFNSLR